MIATERPVPTLRRMFAALGAAARVFLGATAIVVIVLVTVLAVASYSARRAAKAAERHGLEQAADLTAQFLTARGRTLAGGARVFVQGPYFRSLVAQRSRDDMLDQTFEATEQLEADWVFITDERGILLAKSDEPGVVGAAMGSIPLVAGALGGRVNSGFGVSRDSLLFQTVAVPIIVPGAAPVGVLVATKLVDRQLALDVRAATGADVIFYALDAKGVPHLATTSLERPIDAAAALPAAVAAAPRRSDASAASSHLGDVRYALQGASLTTAGGEIVGGFIVARPSSAAAAELVGVRRALVAAGILGLLLAVAAAWITTRRVTRPARSLAAATARALEGDYDDAARLAAGASRSAPNDIAAVGTGLAALLGELREKQSLGAVVGSPAGTPGESGAGDPGDDEPLDRRRSSRPRVSGPRARTTPAGMSRSLGARWSARPAASLPAGAIVADRYEIHDVCGVGGSGTVYRATDRTRGETVALKVLRPELVGDEPREREELERELRPTRRVSHRNVARTYDYGTTGGVPFLTMEYVDGTSLASIIAQRGALPADAVKALARQLIRALDAAHEEGIPHGDLKPANLLVMQDGLLKVTDFGVASLLRRSHATRAGATTGDDPIEAPRLAGAVIGAPEYMAPELLVGGRPDVRTDLYAAGMILHECLTGATPFQRDMPRVFLAQKLEPATESPSAPSPPPHRRPMTLDALIAWMTAPEASERPASAAEVGSILAQLVASER